MRCVLACLAALAAVTYASSDTLNFLVMGDWGGQPTAPYTTPAEVQTAMSMGRIAEEQNSQFVLALGDNFYDVGVPNVESSRFDDTFEHVFTASSLQIPFYVLAGNHDHYGNVTAQIAYSAVNKRWKFSDLWYDFSVPIPNSNRTIQFVMIDTVVLAGNTHDVFRGYLGEPSGPDDLKMAEDQWDWIEKTLSASTADYLVVCGHYPVWSVGEHGPTATLVALLEPKLEKYNVSAYLCGHDHSSQYIRDPKSTVDYHVIGAAHLVDTSTAHSSSVPKNSLQFHWADSKVNGGYAAINVTQYHMYVNFYDDNDKLIYAAPGRAPRNP